VLHRNKSTADITAHPAITPTHRGHPGAGRPADQAVVPQRRIQRRRLLVGNLERVYPPYGGLYAV